ncbi:MAG: hypothetical protein DMF37_05000 [Verrucomicrobia bacterium]|nr:MAG: hypothetical protein DMF37_05000 [Verrucomicrobiota bacterium]
MKNYRSTRLARGLSRSRSIKSVMHSKSVEPLALNEGYKSKANSERCLGPSRTGIFARRDKKLSGSTIGR